MSFDQGKFGAVTNLGLQIVSLLLDLLTLSSECTLAAVSKVEAVLNLAERVLAELKDFEELAFRGIVRNHVEANQCVKEELLKLVHRVLRSVDHARESLLLAVKSADGPLCLEGFLVKADDVLGLGLIVLFNWGLVLMVLLETNSASKAFAEIELLDEHLCLHHVAIL